MYENQVDRRRMLSGGLALASACLLPRRAAAVPATGTIADLTEHSLPRPGLIDDSEISGLHEVELAISHAPFRAEFLAWLREASSRFTLPVSAQVTSPWQTRLHVPGLHPALNIELSADTDINVYVTWKDVDWDIVASMDVYARLTANGSGWQNDLFIPEAKRLHVTREVCWCKDGFESLLEWCNSDLAPANQLALWGGDGCYEGTGWTAAHLARDGRLLHSGKPLVSNGPLPELLPLHANMA